MAEDPEVEALRELADRPRQQGWTMAAALTRYAQPRPELVGQVWEAMRRVLWALGDDGPADQRDVVVQAANRLDGLGDVLVAWAVERGESLPDAEVTSVVQEVGEALEAAGVPHEPREPPPRGRAGRGV